MTGAHAPSEIFEQTPTYGGDRRQAFSSDKGLELSVTHAHVNVIISSRIEVFIFFTPSIRMHRVNHTRAMPSTKLALIFYNYNIFYHARRRPVAGERVRRQEGGGSDFNHFFLTILLFCLPDDIIENSFFRL